MTDEIRPADVYMLVNRIYPLMFVLCGLIVMQIAAKVFLFGRMIRMMTKIELLLKLVEVHAHITDRQKSGVVDEIRAVREETKSAAKVVARTAADTATDVKRAIDEVPAKTVEHLKSAGSPAVGT
jgi:hypothetical protein